MGTILSFANNTVPQRKLQLLKNMAKVFFFGSFSQNGQAATMVESYVIYVKCTQLCVCLAANFQHTDNNKRHVKCFAFWKNAKRLMHKYYQILQMYIFSMVKKITAAAARVATRRDFKDIFLRLHVQKQLHLESLAHFNNRAGLFPQLVFE